MSTLTANDPAISGIQLGGGTFFVTLDSLYDHFAPFGFTSRYEFLEFLIALGNAPIRMPNGTYLIHWFKFLLTIENASSLGSPTFDTRARFDTQGHAVTHAIDPRHLRDGLQNTLTLLLFSRKYATLTNPPAVRNMLNRVVEDLAASMSRVIAATLGGVGSTHQQELSEATSPSPLADDKDHSYDDLARCDPYNAPVIPLPPPMYVPPLRKNEVSYH
jgi:hypothetical protein